MKNFLFGFIRLFIFVSFFITGVSSRNEYHGKEKNFEDSDKTTVYELPKVTVETEHLPFSIDIISNQNFVSMPARNIAEAIQYLPSVFVVQGGEYIQPSVPSLFGAETYQTKVIVDGIELNNQLDGIIDLSAYPMENFEQIEISKGPLSPLWGSSLGGVIFLKTKTPKDTSLFSTNISYGSFQSAKAHSEINVGTDAFRALLIPQYFKSNGYMPGGESERTTCFFKAQYNPSDTFSVKLISGYGDADIQEYNQERFGRKTTLNCENLYYGLKMEWNELFSNESLGGSVQIAGNYTDGERNYYLLPDNHIYDCAKFSEKRNSLKGAFFANYDTSSYLFEGSIDFSKFQSEGFSEQHTDSYYWSLQALRSLSENITAQLVFRYDYHEAFSGEFSYGAGFAWNPINDFGFQCLISHDFNAPPLSYRYINQPERNMKGNNNLKAENGNTIQISAEKSFSRDLRIQWNGFIQRLTDGVVLLQDSTDGFYCFQNIQSIKRQGTEINVFIKPFKNTGLRLGAGYNEAVDEETDEIIPSRGRIKYTVSSETRLLDDLTLNISGYYIWWDMEEMYQADDRHFIFNTKTSWQISENISLYGAIYNIFDQDLYWIDTFPNPPRNYEGGIHWVF